MQRHRGGGGSFPGLAMPPVIAGRAVCVPVR